MYRERDTHTTERDMLTLDDMTEEQIDEMKFQDRASRFPNYDAEMLRIGKLKGTDHPELHDGECLCHDCQVYWGVEG